MSLVDNYVNSVYEALVGWYPGMYLPDIFSSYQNDFNVEVTDGKTTCVGDYHLREVGKDQCSAKYEDDYMHDYDPTDGGQTIKDRSLYLLENSGEFDKCLMEIAEDLPERNPEYGNQKDSEK